MKTKEGEKEKIGSSSICQSIKMQSVLRMEMAHERRGMEGGWHGGWGS